MNKHIVQKAVKVLTRDEGKMFSPYRDSKGYWTIGVGRLIGSKLEELTLSPDIVQAMLIEDIESHWRDVCTIFGAEFLASLEDARQIAILSLIFTLGVDKLQSFTSTIPAIKDRNWERAGTLLKMSKWSRDVDPKQKPGEGRDDRVIEMLVTGKFPKTYGVLNE